MFQQIHQTLGNMDGQYQAKTLAKAFIADVKDVEYSKQSGNPGQSLYLRAENDEIAWVKLTGKFDPLDKTDKGTWRDFLIWPFKPDKATKTYLYCWIQRETSPLPQQGSQQSARATNASQGIVGDAQILAMAERFLKVFEQLLYPKSTGQRPTQPSGTNPEWVGDDPPPPDDTDENGEIIPF